MAQTNFTPILLYASSTATSVPLAANLTNNATGSEIAINIADKNLFFKDSGGVVNTVPIRQSSTSFNGWLSSTDWNTFNNKGSGSVTSVAATVPAFLSVSGSPITTNGTLAITLSGTALPVANGGTGITTTPTNGQIPIGNGTNYTAATITAGNNIAVTNGVGSISIATNISAPQITVYTSGSGTYTVPTNAKYVTVKMVGGGGNGGGSTGTTAGGGGGAGGYLEGIITSLSSTYSYAVGAASGNTTFGSSLFVANAGTAGTSSSATASGGAGGSASGGSLNATGATGGFGWASTPYFNGGMGAGSAFGSGGSGGGTGFGNGFAAVSYGSGGGGAVGGGAAGNGAGGVIIVTAYF
jgi:hypothetical protein